MGRPTAVETLLLYLAEPTTLIAVVAPALLSVGFLYAIKPSAHRSLQWRVFMLGTFLTILASFWREIDGTLSLHLLPGYPLVLVLARTAYRPHPLRAYAFSFFSLLGADLFCAWQYMWLKGQGFSANVYLGVGGAGVGDALFIVPLLCALMMALFDRAERSDLAGQPVSVVLERLSRRLSPPGPGG